MDKSSSSKTDTQMTPEQAYILLSETIICNQPVILCTELRKNFKLLSPQNHHLMKIGCRLKIFDRTTLEYKGAGELLSRFNFPQIKIQTTKTVTKNAKLVIDASKVYIFFKVPMIPALTNFEAQYNKMNDNELNEEFRKRFRL